MNKKPLITAGVVEDLYSLALNCYLYAGKTCLDIATDTQVKFKKQTSSNSTKLQKNISKKTYSYLITCTSILKLFKTVPILITPDIPEEVLISKVRLIKEEIKKELIVKDTPRKFSGIPLPLAEAKKTLTKCRTPSDEYKLLTFIYHVGIYKEAFNKWLENESQGWKAQGKPATIKEILQGKEYHVNFLKKKLPLPNRIKGAQVEPITLNYSQLSTLLKALSKGQLSVKPNTIKRQCSRFLRILSGREMIRAAQRLLEKRKE